MYIYVYIFIRVCVQVVLSIGQSCIVLSPLVCVSPLVLFWWRWVERRNHQNFFLFEVNSGYLKNKRVGGGAWGLGSSTWAPSLQKIVKFI